MIIDLSEPLLMIDNKTHAHTVRLIDVNSKLIYCDALPDDEEDLIQKIKIVKTNELDNELILKEYPVRVFKYGTKDLTVTTKEINLTDEEGNISSIFDENL